MIGWDRLAQQLNADGEFRIAARHWTATVRLDVGTRSHAIRLNDGEVAAVMPCESGDACDVFIGAPPETWARLLEPIPRPFYQDLLAAATHHGLTLNTDLLEIAAYYPALRRLLEILREAREAAR